ncbi:Sir2 family NAD-dependent protein deacetylase [uncultured Microscilla sp.]|uniref:SIR2 family NAD-dependent protein deacylase n=1 Tax=uncultured Microscilla sp. TaxID=432653 RepID=UPI002629E2AF|nr:Sir2 family NAD-dependent protein deacetylase [uncultured Microscilla sp.]
MIPKSLQTFLKQFGESQQKALFLTGAGMSAESGIPTFRGNEGYWTIGSKNYTPMEIATNYMFRQFPEKVWRWVLHYFNNVRQAKPNPGHQALATIETQLGNERFTLVTQNVDGLHLLAGNTPPNTYCIHGTLSHVRCDDCGEVHPFPQDLGHYTKNDIMPDEEWDKLACPECSELMRPHVLFFDEYYNEAYYKYESALEAAFHTDLLVVVGTTGATNLPLLIFETVLKAGKPIIAINLDDSTFTQTIEVYQQGWVIKGKSGEILPAMVRFFM